jgi:hypothetical protein
MLMISVTWICSLNAQEIPQSSSNPTADPKIETTDIKPNFDPANPTVNTTSPDTTAPRLGTMSFGENLTPGKSSAV